MNARNTRTLAAMLLAMLLGAVTAVADSITVGFVGRVTDLRDDGVAVQNTFNTTQIITGTFTFDDTVPVTGGSSNVGDFDGAIIGLSVDIGGYSIGWAPGVNRMETNNSNSNGPFHGDHIRLQQLGFTGAPVDGADPSGFSFSLHDAENDVFANDAAVKSLTPTYNFAGFELGRLFLSFFEDLGGGGNAAGNKGGGPGGPFSRGGDVSGTIDRFWVVTPAETVCDGGVRDGTPCASDIDCGQCFISLDDCVDNFDCNSDGFCTITGGSCINDNDCINGECSVSVGIGCTTNQECENVTPGDFCILGNTCVQDTCTPATCEPTGACCTDPGCSDLTANQCATAGGTYAGDDTFCGGDGDGDGVADGCDECPVADDNTDTDNDGTPDGCDPDCPLFPFQVFTTQQLIDAINCANLDPDEDTILLGADITLTAVDNTDEGPSGLPSIVTPIVIEGDIVSESPSGFTYRTIERDAGAPDFRIFRVGSGGTLTLSETTLRGGSVSVGAPFEQGGGGIIVKNGQLSMTRGTIEDCFAETFGGGLFVPNGTVSALDEVIVSNNTSSTDSGGGVCVLGGGTLSANKSQIIGNNAPGGGPGGGIFNSGSNLLVTNTIVSGNAGGGIVNDGTASLINVTLAGNNAGGNDGKGGGLFTAGNGDTTVTNTVIFGNDATSGTQIKTDGTLDISYSGIQDGLGGDTGSGTVNDLGNNLSLLNTDTVFINPIASSSAPTTAGNNKLAIGSPVIDQGDSVAATSAGLTEDFEGEPRILDIAVDMGADEWTLPREGSCCLGFGDCRWLTEQACLSLAGTYGGDGSPCTPEFCDGPTGACCSPFGGGPLVAGDEKGGGGPACEITTEDYCDQTYRVYKGDDTLCEEVNCGEFTFGACCQQPDGFCDNTTAGTCDFYGQTYQGDNTDCDFIECPQTTGACCFDDGYCEIRTRYECQVQTPGGPPGQYHGDNTVCDPNGCPQPSGACCFDDATCQELTKVECLSQSGHFSGEFTACGGDTDADTVADGCDRCDGVDDLNAADADNDGVPDTCDTCPGEADTDRDGVCDSADLCDGDDFSGDSDGDGLCNDCDPDCTGCPNIAMVTGESFGARFEMLRQLIKTGQFSGVADVSARDETPNLSDLMPYDAVLVWRNNFYDSPSAMGDLIADYHDTRGGVVTGVFENPPGDATHMQGRWLSNAYHVMAISSSSSILQTFATLGTVHDPTHPIMTGVSTFGGGTRNWRPNSTALEPGGQVLAEWSDGKVLVAVDECKFGRPRVDLGFRPPHGNDNSWDSSTDGARLVANAVSYAARPPDEDGDAVFDGCDLCPGTPPLTPVDADGCAVGPTPTLLDAVSRRRHGVANDFDIVLTPNGAPSVDPRANGANPRTVFRYDNPPNNVGCGGVTVINGTCTGTSVVGNDLEIAMTFDHNACVEVTLAGDTVQVLTRQGDVDASGATNILDLAQLKNQLFQPVAGGTFRFDVDCSNTINILDLAVTKNNLFAAVACP